MFRVAVGRALLLMLLPVSIFGQKPNFDALGEPAVRTGAQAAVPAAQAGMPVHMESRLGVPVFIWTTAQAPALPAGPQREEAAARSHLSRYASQYRLDPADINDARLAAVHNTGAGPIIVAFHQSLDDIEIFRDEVKIIMKQDLELIGISGYMVGRGNSGAVNRIFTLSPSQALAAAIADLLDLNVDAQVFQQTGTQDAYALFQVAPSANAAPPAFQLAHTARVKRVFFRLPTSLEAAYYVEIEAKRQADTDTQSYGYVISAADGSLLLRINQTANDAYSYRVWADTTGIIAPLQSPYGNDADPKDPPSPDPSLTFPPYVMPSLVTLQNGPISTTDPWLPHGSSTSVGNNVEAFADLTAPDGFTANSSDVYASITSPGTFDRTYDTSLTPQANSNQIQAAVTQLFYDINFFHDWYYDSGFKETDGNAQLSNYGRGGLENDSIIAEAQDFAARNNANMTTPSDGQRPRMRMYVWDGPAQHTLVAHQDLLATAFVNGIAQFGPTNFNVTAPVSLTSPANGCTSISTDLTGQVAFIDRGGCNFDFKVKNAQNSGAVAVIIGNVASSASPTTAPTMAPGTPPTTGVTIGALSVNVDDGNYFRSTLGAGNPIQGALTRITFVDRDGTIDNQIVAHEWGHYISNRLIFNSTGIITNMARGLGEGWADFHALLLTVNPEDSLVASNTTFNGAYPLAMYAGHDNYFGIRRVPYSTDFTKDPLTFQHIANGVTLPAGVPIAFDLDGSTNSEVHNTGEIWASMLWECYASMLRDTLGSTPRLTFEAARSRMKAYIVAAYKMTPANPTLLEARDALLAAAFATDNTDYLHFWQAFATRGAGINAVAPDRYSLTNAGGLAESYLTGGAFSITSMTLADSVTSCDHDGTLDNGETGKLTLVINNTGSVALNATMAAVTSTNPHVSFPAGNQIGFSAMQPLDTATAAVLVSLNGAAGAEELDFVISISDPALASGGAINAGLTIRGNASSVLNASATDNVEAAISAWTPVLAAGPASFTRQMSTIMPINFVWHGPDLGISADRSLVSPVLTVGAGALSFSISHRYSFDTDGTSFFDGGVIELSTDNGAHWTDIGSGYTHVIPSNGGNVLAGRQAYSGVSLGYPNMASQSINLGTTYAGQNIKIRFRIGEDSSGPAIGWDIDDLAFTGLANTPFTQLIADTLICTRKRPGQITSN